MADNPILAKVTDSDPDRPDPEKAPWSLVLTGWAIAIGVTLLQFVLMALVDGVAEARFDRVIAREQPLLWWSEDSLAYAPFVIITLPFFALILWAHGMSRYGRDKPWPPLWRKRLLIGGGAAIVAASGFVLLFGGQAGGLAFEDGAAWFRNGRVVDRRPWSAAISLLAGCSTYKNGRNNTGELRPSFSYEVFFGNRSARMSLGGAPSPEWLRLMTPIDAQLRAAGVRRRGVIKEECLQMLAEPGMSAGDLRTLIAP